MCGCSCPLPRYHEHARQPARAEGVEVGGMHVAHGAISHEPPPVPVITGLGQSFGGGADNPVLDGIQRDLEHLHSGGWPLVYGGIEHVQAQRPWVGIAMRGVPVPCPVDILGDGQGQLAHGAVIAVLPGHAGGDAIHGFAARVFGIVAVAALMGEDDLHGTVESGHRADLESTWQRFTSGLMAHAR